MTKLVKDLTLSLILPTGRCKECNNPGRDQSRHDGGHATGTACSLKNNTLLTTESLNSLISKFS